MKKLIMKNKEISGVTLVFENSETMTIPYKYLLWLQVTNVTQDVSFICFGDQTSCDFISDSLLLSIKDSFLKEYNSDGDFWFDEDLTTKERLQKNDITSVSLIVNKKGVVEDKLSNLNKPDLDTISSIILEQGEIIDINVPWDYSDDYVNHYQKCEDDTDGFTIRIEKKNSTEKDEKD